MPVVRSGLVLKWPGGKAWLATGLAEILRQELSDGGCYYEPFVGGGAVFFRLEPNNAVLSDVNSALMEFYDVLRKRPCDLIKNVWRNSNCKDTYYRVRGSRPITSMGRAARFLFLNRTCWGGVYRVNKNGEFNVPFGNSGRSICNKGNAIRAARALSRSELLTCDFEGVLERAGNGDVIYLDPPYSQGFGKNCFGRYHSMGFVWEDHLRLVRSCERAVSRGAFVCVSAAMDRALLSSFKGWFVASCSRHSLVGRTSESRMAVREALIFSRPPSLLG
jgi:DNA adenine methylase